MPQSLSCYDNPRVYLHFSAIFHLPYNRLRVHNNFYCFDIRTYYYKTDNNTEGKYMRGIDQCEEERDLCL